MSAPRLARPFWIAAAAILVVFALAGVAVVLLGDFSETDVRVLGTVAAALLAGGSAVTALAVAERSETALGWAALALTPLAFAAALYAIWNFSFDGEDDAWRYGWTGLLALIAALIATSARLLAPMQPVVWLSRGAGLLGAAAALVSVVAVWQDDPDESIGKAIVALWTLAVLVYLLVPLLQRYTAMREAGDERVLDELDGIALVATRAGTIDPQLAPGERLALRRRI